MPSLPSLVVLAFADLAAEVAALRAAWDNAHDFSELSLFPDRYWRAHAFMLAVAPFRSVTLPNGRIVLTNFVKDDHIHYYDRVMSGDDDGYERYCEKRGIVAHPWMISGRVIEMGAVPGSPYDLALKYDTVDDIDPEIELYWEECDRDAERDADIEAIELDSVYARLERVRPKSRRRKPLPDYHFKRWGHGNAREMINRVGQFAFMAG